MKPGAKKRRLRPVHIIVLGFLALIITGGLLLWLPVSRKAELSFVDALFTSASATCLTGLGVANIAEDFTVFGQIVILLLIQTAGLGLMTLATMVLMLLRRKFTLRDRLIMQEALGQQGNKGIVRLTKNVTAFVFCCEAAGFILLMPPFIKAEGARGIFTAMFTSVSAFCNAGLEIFKQSDSLTAFQKNPLVLLTIAALVILGGLGFVVVSDAGKKRFRFKKYLLHTKIVFVATVVLLSAGTAVFLAAEYSNPDTLGGMGFGYKLLNAFFQSVTCRTAGFKTIDQAALTPPSNMTTIFLMFVGGSPGSAAGGVKTTTIALTVLIFASGFSRKNEIVAFKRNIDKNTCLRAAATFAAGLIFVMGLSFALLFSEQKLLAENGFSMGAVLFEAVSAFSTTGLSMGITHLLSALGKILLIIAMFVGKIGAITLGALFFGGQNKEERLKYPEGQVMLA